MSGPPAPRKAPRGRDTGPDAATRALLEARDGGVCVVCGQPGSDWDPLTTHHRKNRGAGGSKNPGINRPTNLLRVHASINQAFEDSNPNYYANGWKLRDVRDAPTTPVLYPDGRWFLLDEQGNRTETDPPNVY